MENFYQLLIGSMPYPLWVKDLEGRFIFVNELFASLYHLKKEDFLQKTNEQVFHKEQAEIYNRLQEEFMLNKSIQKLEGSINGRYAECIIYPILDEDRETVAYSGIINDGNEKNAMKQQLQHLSHKDLLTGLYSRNHFEKAVSELKWESYMTVSVIMCDVNGLRFINSAFGQSEGDKLIKVVAEVLKDTCKDTEYIFRWGGDEFTALLMNHDEKSCEKIIKQIIEAYNTSKNKLLDLSLSVGSATAEILKEHIFELIKEAELHLFRQKLLEEKSVRGSIMFSLQNSLEAKNVETEKHTERMIEYSMALGKLLNFKISELDELVLVTKLHDIGKIGISEDILLKPGKLTDEEFEVMKTHTEKGRRIVEVSNELAHIGRGILTHHERWDGKGYPLGLKGEEIPLISRIVSVVDSYDAMTNDRVYKKGISKEEAIEELKRCSGYQFDPQIVELFIQLIQNEK